METGVLVLVVGPSGAGKDTLIDAAREALRDDPCVRFARRVITRPAGAGGEAHEEATQEDFAGRRFAFAWTAHGLHYGISEVVAEEMMAGHVVIANVSRGVIAEAAARFPVRVIEVAAPPAVLAARLAARGREDAAARTARLSRSIALPDCVPIETVLNDASLAEGAARFLAAISRARSGALPAGTVLPALPG